jgi:hypothetical protein
MTSRDFCYWLQGYFEISHIDGQSISEEKADVIKRHLNLVFEHEIDPSIDGGNKDIKEKLMKIHGGSSTLDDMLIRC